MIVSAKIWPNKSDFTKMPYTAPSEGHQVFIRPSITKVHFSIELKNLAGSVIVFERPPCFQKTRDEAQKKLRLTMATWA